MIQRDLKNGWPNVVDLKNFAKIALGMEMGVRPLFDHVFSQPMKPDPTIFRSCPHDLRIQHIHLP
jgi:hypothetical protein